MNFSKAQAILIQALNIVVIDSEINELEDEYWEVWLQEGPPDGCSLGEIVDSMEQYYEEWSSLGERLLEARENEEEI